MRQIHSSEVKSELNKAERIKSTDSYDIVVATLGSVPVAHYKGYIVGRYATTERYRIKLESSGQIRTFPLCLVMEFEGAEVIW